MLGGNQIMSSAKSTLIDRIKNISDDLDEMQIIEQLYVLNRLEHSKRRCEEEGTISTEELKNHFANKRRAYAGV